MKRFSRAILWSVFAGLFHLILAPLPAFAGEPTNQVRTTVDGIVAILKNPRLKSEARKKERREQLRKAILPSFDFAEMAKRSLGSQWRQRTPEEQREFVRVFSDLLENSYVDRIEAYNEEKFVYQRENLDGDFAQVDTKVITHKGEEFSINYRLHRVGGQWKAYDVVVENISLVNNYRSQFNRIIANSSYEELIQRMKEKQLKVVGASKE